MRLFLAFIVVFTSHVGLSQYFQIVEIKAVDGNEFESIFPEVQARSGQDDFAKTAANRINTYLQYHLLSHVYGKESDNIFENVFPPEGEFYGQSEFSYRINVNNEKIFSVTIDYATTGAYIEYVNESFNFSAETGEHITLDDLFNDEQRRKIGTEVANSCASQISHFLKNIDESDAYAEDYHVLYDECLEYFQEMNDFPSHYFYMTEDGIVFKAYRCSNHMMAALDELWEFEIPYSIEALSSNLRPQLVKTLMSNGNWVSVDNQIPSYKVLTGTVDDKYPITAVFSNLNSDFLHGAYWYDKYKKPITLSGKRTDDGRYLFEEETNGKVTANIEFILQNDQFKGVWEKTDQSSSLPIVLRIE